MAKCSDSLCEMFFVFLDLKTSVVEHLDRAGAVVVKCKKQQKHCWEIKPSADNIIGCNYDLQG